MHDEFQIAVVEESKEVVEKLKIYLRDEKTVRVLLPPLLV
jgi:hypothetical protein